MREIQWFTTSPDAGDPACICSWCGKLIAEGEVPARCFDGDSEARFHQDCYAVPAAILTGQIPNPAIPAIYRPPYGLPLNWRDEMTGALTDAVLAFISYGTGQGPEPTAVQLWLVAEYIRHYVNAPCWAAGPEVTALRENAEGLETAEDITGFIRQALEIGIDPL